MGSSPRSLSAALDVPDHLTYECGEDGTCSCPCSPDSSSGVNPPAQSALSVVDAASSKQCETISKVCRTGGRRGRGVRGGDFFLKEKGVREVMEMFR